MLLEKDATGPVTAFYRAPAAACSRRSLSLFWFCRLLSGRRRGENDLGDSLLAPSGGIPGKPSTLDEPIQDRLVLGEKTDRLLF